MTSVIVVDRSGHEHSLDGVAGQTLMEAIRDSGLDELLALCGGCLSCATCHVHVDRDSTVALSPMSDDENDLLDSSDHRTPQSRLSCQIPLGSHFRVCG